MKGDGGMEEGRVEVWGVRGEGSNCLTGAAGGVRMWPGWREASVRYGSDLARPITLPCFNTVQPWFSTLHPRPPRLTLPDDTLPRRVASDGARLSDVWPVGRDAD